VLRARTGIVEHGPFIDIANDPFVANANGVVGPRGSSRDGMEEASG